MHANEPPAVLEAAHLVKVFRDFWKRPTVRAVNDLSLTLRPGEVFGLLGPNGSGKSTTIKMILGLLHPSRGTIRVFGRTPGLPDVNARLGYLPELSVLYHYLTPRETLDFYGGLFDLPRALRRERAGQLIEAVGLAAAADRPVGEFSKGMARRVGLAQALLNDPDLVILDEPTSGLDPIGRHHVKRLIETLAQRGKTVLLSSHLLGEIQDVCSRIAILFDGRLVAEGRIGEILTRREQIRLTMPAPDPAALETLCEVIARSAGRRPVVEHPSLSLEEFFLETVARAEPGAAATVPEVPAFLGAPARAERDAR